MFKRRSTQPTSRQRVSPESGTNATNFSYSSVRQQTPDQPANPEKLGHFWLQRIGLLIFLVVATASLVNIASLTPSAKVLPLSTSTSQSFLRPTSTYEAATNQLLKQSVWNRTKVTINAASISQQLLQEFPELTSVSLTVPLLAHRPLVYIAPAQPAVILSGSNGSYVIDTTGKALIKLTQANQLNAKLPILTDQSGLQMHLNHQVLPASSVQFLQVVLAELAAKHFSVDSLVLPPASSELDVRLKGQPYFVKFNLQSTNPRGEAGTFIATITGLKKQSITPAQYVDVRVDGRAYYQ